MRLTEVSLDNLKNKRAVDCYLTKTIKSYTYRNIIRSFELYNDNLRCFDINIDSLIIKEKKNNRIYNFDLFIFSTKDNLENMKKYLIKDDFCENFYSNNKKILLPNNNVGTIYLVNV